MKNPLCFKTNKNLLFKSLYFFAIILFFNKSAIAQENSNNEFLIKIKDHRFEPSIINVPANTNFKLVIENLDKTLEEFESDDLKKEKLVASGKKITIPVNGLNAGEYKFYGDFHQKTAQGKIIVK